jgi:SAM-dependent methyltransferase
MSMDPDSVRAHWQDWAGRFGGGLRATTKTATIKALELAAAERAIRQNLGREPARLLEIGCGNAFNLVHLVHAFAGCQATGIDYIADMVGNACNNIEQAEVVDRVQVFEGDASQLDDHPELQDNYDVVLSNRCLINLKPWELQAQAINQAAAKVAPGGLFIVIENIVHLHAGQNHLRQRVGLPVREPAAFNLFLAEEQLCQQAQRQLSLVRTDDFGSLHDLLLYVLVPMCNGGEVDYEHPLVEAATRLSLACDGDLGCGSYGQNRLYVFRRDG